MHWYASFYVATHLECKVCNFTIRGQIGDDDKFCEFSILFNIEFANQISLFTLDNGH